MRIIKTYANGRFYDTLDKKYLSKDQLVAFIKKNQAFQIVMHKTGKDVTKSVLKPMGAVPPLPKRQRAISTTLRNGCPARSIGA